MLWLYMLKRKKIRRESPPLSPSDASEMGEGSFFNGWKRGMHYGPEMGKIETKLFPINLVLYYDIICNCIARNWYSDVYSSRLIISKFNILIFHILQACHCPVISCKSWENLRNPLKPVKPVKWPSKSCIFCSNRNFHPN